MQQSGWARIVNISSGPAHSAGSIGAHYNASKAGTELRARADAAHLVERGIAVIAVAPSPVTTDIIADQKRDGANHLHGARVGTVQQVTEELAFVAFCHLIITRA